MNLDLHVVPRSASGKWRPQRKSRPATRRWWHEHGDPNWRGHATVFLVPEVRPGQYSIHGYATQGTIIDDPTHGEIVSDVMVSGGRE